MEHKLLGKIQNDGKMATWSQPDREAETVKIWNEMQQPIPQELLEKMSKAPISSAKSKVLFRWVMETMLTFENCDEQLNIIMLAHDPKTNESTQLLWSCESKDPCVRIDKLIALIDKECRGSRIENGNVVSSELLTIIANACAIYCATDQLYKESFKDAVKYWEERLAKQDEKKD